MRATMDLLKMGTKLVQALEEKLSPKQRYWARVRAEYCDLRRDEFAEHLMFVLGGFMVQGNLNGFECCIKNMPAEGAVLEIGSFLGLSTTLIAYAMAKYGRGEPFFACDPWVFAGADRPKAGYFSTGTQEYRDWVVQSFKMNTTLFSKDHPPYAIEATSDQFFRWWSNCAVRTDLWGRDTKLGGGIGFAFIDGAHTYEAARNDFLNADRFLLPRGYLFFDDSYDDGAFAEVQRVVSEVRANSRYELIGKFPNYCFRKRQFSI
jgi:hypothetical protein